MSFTSMSHPLVHSNNVDLRTSPRQYQESLALFSENISFAPLDRKRLLWPIDGGGEDQLLSFILHSNQTHCTLYTCIDIRHDSAYAYIDHSTNSWIFIRAMTKRSPIDLSNNRSICDSFYSIRNRNPFRDDLFLHRSIERISEISHESIRWRFLTDLLLVDRLQRSLFPHG